MISQLVLILIPLAWVTLTVVVLAACAAAARADAARSYDPETTSCAGPEPAGAEASRAGFQPVPAR